MIAGRGPGLKGRAVLALRLSHRGPRGRGRRDEESTVNHQRRLVLVLGDQLSLNLSSLAGAPPKDCTVLMAEVGAEVGYAPHHAKKLALLFSAMRHHAERLRAAGYRVDYVTLDDPANAQSLPGELERAYARLGPFEEVVVTRPGEWRVQETLDALRDSGALPLRWEEDDRFFASREDFARWAKGRKQLRMEYFYRALRRKTGLLMEGDQPAGGQWNFDADNRQGWPKKAADRPVVPAPYAVAPDDTTEGVLSLIEGACPDAFGELRPFSYAVTAEDAERVLAHFIETRLANFGTYQDAMAEGDPWLFHSHIALYLNIGLLDPRGCCEAAEAAYRAGKAPLNAVEGFIRQILGWREFVRGIYWHFMPGYDAVNALEATRPLPAFYWSGETKMACVAEAVRSTRTHGYAHHIQRLMVTGNFALLAGLDPQEVSAWYLGVYVDAFEWVELPNVVGMALFADGGQLASKPYAASGKYIDRMSNYCKGCAYTPKETLGPTACPFNALYWDFLERHPERLGKNPRLGMIYRSLEKMAPEKRAATRAKAAELLETLELL